MILIFGGTTEGRMAVEVCEVAGKPFYYSTKGDSQEVPLHHGIRLTGILTAADICQFAAAHGVRCIVDAAHPFAQELHANIHATCLPVIRLERSYCRHYPEATYCKDYIDALNLLNESPAECLLALSGVNTIPRLRDYWLRHRTLFRILHRPESIRMAQKNQFPLQNLIFYTDEKVLPTVEQERELMQQVGCDAILTKESGESGGFEAKVEAALQLGLRVFVVQRPPLPADWIYVTGPHGLRRSIEQLVPDFFSLRTGFTTGACATAAVKAALLSLLYDEQPDEVHFSLPDCEIMVVPVEVNCRGMATVVKDFSDDPDVTRGCRISAKVEWGHDGIRFLRGKGVGRVTLPGLGIPVGGPAINPTPRQMIVQEVRDLTASDVDITLSVEDGEQLAQKTFNPRVGVLDGISIIGTSGIVSPLSNEAFIQSIERELQVARAIGCSQIGFASGRRGEEALHATEPDLRVIHYGNFIGASLQMAYEQGFQRAVVGIMIGKAVKLAEGNLDTHSHKVTMNKDFLRQVAGPNDSAKIEGITLARELWEIMPPSFFQRIQELCYQHCRTMFPSGELEIRLICDNPV